MLLVADRIVLAEDLAFEIVKLPALRIDGRAAQAHTQGMEVVDGRFYVTARRDDVLPRRALLIRTDPIRSDWDVWDITPLDPSGAVSALDHPGGMQSDGKRLWIPVAESRRQGRSVLRAYSLAGLVRGDPAIPELDLPINDHIGALAFAEGRQLLLGANWDTESVYVWDMKGRLTRTLTGPELKTRRLGGVAGSADSTGLAVQDWKWMGDYLYASGLMRRAGSGGISSSGQFVSFGKLLDPDVHSWSVVLPRQGDLELGREAMAVVDGMVYFLPEDLAATNRLFRIPLAALQKQSTTRQ